MHAAWLGWIALALILTAFTLAFVKQRMNKTEEKLNPSHYVVNTVDDFPTTHVPREAVASFADAEAAVVALDKVYDYAWAMFGEFYSAPFERSAPIDTIGMSLGPVHPDHKDVVWFAPSSKMRLRFQPTMRFHFAGELHNMFRFNLHGIKHIYKTKDAADKARALKVQAWIKGEYA